MVEVEGEMDEQAAGEAGAADVRVPPYISFKTFQTFLSELKEHGIPNKIDRTVLGRFAGSVGTQLMGSIRWLGLVNDDMEPLRNLTLLVETYDTPHWPTTLQTLLKKRYAFVIELDLARATPGQFTEAFKRFNAKDDVIAKSRRFFLQAAQAANIEINARILQRAKPQRITTKQARANGKNAHEQEKPPPPPPREHAISPYSMLIDILDPNEMSEEEQHAVWTLIRYVKAREMEDD